MSRVLILGATSRVAGEVAKIHAARGDTLHLVGRSPEKLGALVRDLGARATSEALDFSRTESAEGCIARAAAALGRIDAALVAHGELGDQLESERSYDEAARILEANLTSTIALLVPLANHLERAGRGRLGVITSVAAERGRPRNYTYGAAKGALNVYLQGLRSRLWRRGVSVTTLKLGPVDTPMTKGHAKSLLFSTPERVAEGIVRAMDRRVAVAFVPSFWAIVMPIVRAMPEALFQRISSLSGR